MNFLLWYAIMRTPFFADRSVQNKSEQFLDCPSVDAPKKLYKNVFFWGLRKCIKNGTHDQRNNEIFRKSYSPKNQRFLPGEARGLRLLRSPLSPASRSRSPGRWPGLGGGVLAERGVPDVRGPEGHDGGDGDLGGGEQHRSLGPAAGSSRERGGGATHPEGSGPAGLRGAGGEAPGALPRTGPSRARAPRAKRTLPGEARGLTKKNVVPYGKLVIPKELPF